MNSQPNLSTDLSNEGISEEIQSGAYDLDVECPQLDLNAVKLEVEQTKDSLYIDDALEYITVKEEDISSIEFPGELV